MTYQSEDLEKILALIQKTELKGPGPHDFCGIPVRCLPYVLPGQAIILNPSGDPSDRPEVILIHGLAEVSARKVSWMARVSNRLSQIWRWRRTRRRS